MGILFAQAALEGASLNVFINTRLMKDRSQAEELNARADRMIAEGREKKERIYSQVLQSVK